MSSSRAENPILSSEKASTLKDEYHQTLRKLGRLPSKEELRQAIYKHGFYRAQKSLNDLMILGNSIACNSL